MGSGTIHAVCIRTDWAKRLHTSAPLFWGLDALSPCRRVPPDVPQRKWAGGIRGAAKMP